VTPLEELPDDEIIWALLAILAERRPISWEDGLMLRRDLEMWRSLCGEVNHA
jgi:hypothetical protein